MTDPLAYICHCGHVEDEHGTGLLQECAIEGCDCIAYEAADEEPS